MNDTTTSASDPRHILYPPGGLFVWSLVLMEIFTFGVGMIAFFVSSAAEPELFHASRLKLNPVYGVVNTVFLLASGYFLALSVERLKRGEAAAARRLLDLTLLGGLLFVLLKGVEYWQKLTQGLTLGFDTFFTYYWLLTIFHLMHVLVGVVILLCMRARLKPGGAMKHEDYEAGGVFWHMCDLIWLLLFPALYLIV